MDLKKNKIVALCGPDGSGKTSIFELLKHNNEIDNAIYIPRGPSNCEHFIEKNFPRKYFNYKDWMDSSFSNAIAFACAIDYYEYYMNTTNLFEETGKILISDRYSTCFIAYANALKRKEKCAIDLLNKIPPPDLVIFLTCDTKILKERIKDRGTTNEFESHYCQKRFIRSYLDIFALFKLPVIYISNNNSIHQTYEETKQSILKII